MTTIGDGIEKVVHDITTAIETALPYIAGIAFEFALHTAAMAL